MPIIPISGYINDEPQHYKFLFKLVKKVLNSDGDIEFQFAGCNFLAQNAIAIIGGLTQIALQQEREVLYDFVGINPKVEKHINENGFLDAFEIGNNYVKNTSVPFRIDLAKDSDAYTDYLRHKWLSSRISLQEELKDAVVTNVIEAYLNVFDHADSTVGVITCGQHFPQRNNELVVTMVDFGVGIPHNVRQFLENPAMDAKDAVQWAFQSGKTTKPNLISRGLGLKVLKSFVQANNGKLEIYSDSAYIRLDKQGEKVQQMPEAFGGTVVQVTLKCNSRYYKLEEISKDEKPLF
jgi:anti-sigma regulatory factor (Ser/Thr protein kinase)